jgi:hypothetical protein
MASLLNSSLRSAAIAATLAVASANALAVDVVYDALTGATAHAAYDANGDVINRYQYQSFAASSDPTDPSVVSEAITSLGDYISLSANAGRSITGMDIGVVQGQGTAAIDFKIKLSIFSAVDHLLVEQISSTAHLDAAAASTTANGTASIVSLSFGAFNLPDTFYYTLALETPTTAPANFGIWLWDYYQDGAVLGAIPVGTDIGNTGSVDDGSFNTQVYGTVAGSDVLTTDLGVNNTAGLSDGYTLAVRFNVETPVTSPIPEPSTYALMFGGLAALGVVARRRKQNQA